MKYQVKRTTSFKKSFKRLIKNRNFDKNNFMRVVNILSKGELLDGKYLDHKLNGFKIETRECHLQNDILLVYRHEDNILTLYLLDIGSHSELFK